MRAWRGIVLFAVALLLSGACSGPAAHAQPIPEPDTLRGLSTRFVRDVGRYRYEGRYGYTTRVGRYRVQTVGRLSLIHI